MRLNSEIFREYDIRGIADKDLASDVIYNMGRALALVFRDAACRTITLGRDCRLSSDRIFTALSRGLLESGIDVVDVGIVPTPLLYFSVVHLKSDGGVMITGSHNPAEYNGIKVVVGKSTIYGEQIQQILHLIEKGAFVSGKGKLSEKSIIPAYIDYVVNNIEGPLSLKVVVDSGNGMAGIVAPQLYRKLGCEVIELFSDLDGTFPNHHPDPTELKNLQALISEVKRSGALLGIGFDGDADRIGAIDSSGRVIYGDELLVIYSRDILQKSPGAKIISEVKASHRLFDDIRGHGGIPILWKTGHSLIKAKMKEENALLAGEMSGHMFFNDRYFGYDDAIYAGARLLEIASKTKKGPSALLAGLPTSFTTPELRVDCPDRIKFEVVAAAREEFKGQGIRVNDIDGARLEFSDGWGLVRASNTQPVLVYRFEATSERRLLEIKNLVESTVHRIVQAHNS